MRLLIAAAGLALAAAPAAAEPVCLSAGPSDQVSVACGPRFVGLDGMDRGRAESDHRPDMRAAQPADRAGPTYPASSQYVKSYSHAPQARFTSATAYSGGYRDAGRALLGGPEDGAGHRRPTLDHARDYRYDPARIHGAPLVNTKPYSHTTDSARHGHSEGRHHACHAHHRSADYVSVCEAARDHRAVRVVRGHAREEIRLDDLALTGGVGAGVGGFAYGGGGGVVVVAGERARFSGIAGASARASASASVTVHHGFRGFHGGGKKGH